MAISVLIPAIMKQLPFRLFNSSCVAIHKTILFFFAFTFMCTNMSQTYLGFRYTRLVLLSYCRP